MVVVADLVARLRREGVEETTRALSAAETQAKATGEQLDQLARKMAATSGGTVGQARQILETQALSATQVAQALGTASTSAGRLATAAQQVTAPAQAAAKAATDLHEGFRLSESSALRFGLGMVGIGAGLSIATKLAEVLHGAIIGTVNAQTEWERGLVRARVLYGDIGRQVVEISKAQAIAPGEAGSQVERLQANLNASYLVTRYGVSLRDVARLTGSAAAVSQVFGEDEQARRDRQARTLAFAEGGGDVLRDIGAEGRPLDIARRLGGVNAEQLQAFTPPQLAQIQLLRATEANERAALEGGTDRPGLLTARATYEKALSDAQGRLQNYLEGNPIDDDKLRAMITSQAPRNALEAQQQQEQLAQIAARAPTQEVDDARRALEANIKAITDHTQALEDARKKLEASGIEVGGAVWRILGFSGNPEDPLSFARGDIGAQVQAGLASRMRSAIPGIGTPNAEIAALSTQSAFAMAYQNYTARAAQQVTDNANREFLERRATAEAGAGRDRNDRFQAAVEANTPAGRALQEAERTAPVLRRMDEARRSQQLIDMQAAQQQADLEQITLTQRERHLQLMRETVDLRKLDVQQQMQGLQLGQAVIRAQQAALPTQNAASAAQFQSDMAVALSQRRMARLLQGKDVSDIPTVDELIRMNVSGQLASAELAPDVVGRARDIAVAQQPATAAQLAEAITGAQIRAQELTVELANLGELPQQTALELELVAMNRDQLSVQRELREYTKQLVWIMTNQLNPGYGAPPAPTDLPGNRRGGPY